jgi:TolA-binding protein
MDMEQIWHDLRPLAMFSTLIYSCIGLAVFAAALWIMQSVSPFSIRKEIEEDQNTALAIIVGLLFLYFVTAVILALINWAVGSGAIRVFFLFPLDGVLQLYLFMVLGHLLGYMAYQTRYKLKWWPENLAEPVFMVKGQPVSLSYQSSRIPAKPSPPPRPAPNTTPPPSAGAKAAPINVGSATSLGAAGAGAAAMAAAAGAAAAHVRPSSPPTTKSGPAPGLATGPASAPQEDLARLIADGMSMLDHGRHDEAAALFKDLLAKYPNHTGALRGVVLASLRLNDLAAVREYGARQGAALCGQKSYEAMFEVFTELRKTIPDFIFGAKDQFMLGRWLADSDRPLEAAKVLRELGVSYPDDPLAPKALFQCGELLWRRCAKPESAVQMFNYILKKYPEVAFADQVRAAINQLSAGR